MEGGDEFLETSADVVTMVSGWGIFLREWRERSGVWCGEASGRVV